jgi:predicted permease
MSGIGSMARVLRGLSRKLPFLAVVLGTLAMSTGAATAMFSIVSSFLLSSLPYEDADRLVMIWRTSTESVKKGIDVPLPLAPGEFADLTDVNHSFEQVAALGSDYLNVTGTEEPHRIHVMAASAQFFPLLRMKTAIGRGVEPGDLRLDAPRIAVLGNGYWRRQLGGDPGVIGRKLQISGRSFEIVGVLPAGFHFTESLLPSDARLSQPVDVWIPLRLREGARERGYHAFFVVARLKPGVCLRAAKEEMRAYAEHAAERYPDSDKGYGMKVVSLSDQIFGHLRPVLLTLFAATGFVVLIGCANLAALLMARGEEGRREVAVRLALGASRWRIAGESLLESVLLALAGGLLGLGVAFAATRVMTALSPVNVFQTYPVRVDGRVWGFTLAVSVACGLLFGLIPALRASRVDTVTGLREGSLNTTARSRLMFFLLVISEVSLATTLLVGSGLSVKSFLGLLRVDLGVRMKRVATMDLFLPLSEYGETPKKVGLLREMLARIKALPEVEAVGMNYGLPLSGVDPSNGFTIVERPPLTAGEIQSANLGLINADYFQALGIPFLRGRTFQESDTEGRPPVAIVDERMVKQYFKDEDPLGKRLTIANNTPRTIVGVVGTLKQDTFEETARPYVYLPYQQFCYMYTRLAVKTRGKDPLRVVAAVRGVVQGLDKNLPISNVSTLEESYRKSIAPQRFSMILVTLFAAVALLLTQVGIYGVMNFLSRQRQREVGIRVALGAAPGQVFRLLVRQGFVLSLAGAALGLGIALLASKTLASLVYGIDTVDLIVFCAVPVLTLLAAFLAYFRPARDLSGVDPMEILRAD